MDIEMEFYLQKIYKFSTVEISVSFENNLMISMK